MILASGSRYKIELLERLCIPFTSCAPNIDETPHEGESVRSLVSRLAQTKAEKIAKNEPKRWVLGADQSAEIDGKILAKPGTIEKAAEQLAQLNGREVVFHNCVAIVNLDRNISEFLETEVRAKLRPLSQADIYAYIMAEKPLDCVGSFKCEGLGISLFEYIESDDPTGLVGLPLISVSSLLRKTGYLKTR